MLEQPLSRLLKSPLKKEFALLAQLSTSPVLNNEKITLQGGFIPVSSNEKLITLLRNKLVITADDFAKETYFSKEELARSQSRIKLLSSLQITNIDTQNSVLKSLGKTITRAGQASFVSLLAQGNTDWKVTQNRQSFIRALAESPKLLQDICADLEIIKEYEEVLAVNIPLAANLLDAMSKVKKVMMVAGFEVFLFYVLYLKNPADYAYLTSLGVVNLYFLCMYALSKLSQTEAAGNLGVFLLNMFWVGAMASAAGMGLACLTNYKEYGLKVLQFLSANKQTYNFLDRLILPVACIAVIFGIYKLIQFTGKAGKDAFASAKGIAQLVRSADSLYEKIQTSSNPILKDAFGLDFAVKLSPAWNDLVSKAKDSTFDASAEHRFFSTSQPRILKVMSLLETTIEDFSNVLQMYGEVDAYASMAQLYLDTRATTNQKGEPVRSCFVDLIEESEESVLKAKGFWHPILPQAVVRTNTLLLGGGGQNARNAIITGPNAAGKSVSMKALLTNILLGQTFGVACAETFAFTPYSKIIARFTSADNTASNQSKFMLEASDVVALLKDLEELAPGEKAFVVTDELFSGTEVKPAILLSIELCSEIARMKNVNYLLATHYKDLTKLPEVTHGAFENLKVTASVDDNSHVSYDFKLQPGVGDVNVAFDIFLDQMRSQGLNNERLEHIIKNARGRNEITTHPEEASAGA